MQLTVLGIFLLAGENNTRVRANSKYNVLVFTRAVFISQTCKNYVSVYLDKSSAPLSDPVTQRLPRSLQGFGYFHFLCLAVSSERSVQGF